MHWPRTLLVTLVLFLCQIADAQPVLEWSVPSEGLLREGGLWVDGKWMNEYQFEAQPDVPLVISMNSPDFDTFVWVGDYGLGFFLPFESADDGGEGTNTRMVFTAPFAGTFGIRATSYTEATTGTYTLTVRPLVTRPSPDRVFTGAELTNLLGEDSGIDEEERFFDTYALTLYPDTLYTFTARSRAFDAALILTSASGLDEYSDDFEESSSDARIQLEGPATPERVNVSVTSYGANQLGRYTLSVDRSPIPPIVVRPARRLFPNEVVEDEILFSDPRSEEGRYRDFEVVVQPGQTLYLRASGVMHPTQVQPVLGVMEDGAFIPLIEPDFRAEEWPIVQFMREAKTYTVRVTHVENPSAGGFSIEMNLEDGSLANDPLRNVPTLQMQERDDTFEYRSIGGQGMMFRLEGRRGETWTVRLNASFDTTLLTSALEHGLLRGLAFDDDGDGFPNPRLEVTFEQDGPIFLKVGTFRDAAEFQGQPFRLIVER